MSRAEDLAQQPIDDSASRPGEHARDCGDLKRSPTPAAHVTVGVRLIGAVVIRTCGVRASGHDRSLSCGLSTRASGLDLHHGGASSWLNRMPTKRDG